MRSLKILSSSAAQLLRRAFFFISALYFTFHCLAVAFWNLPVDSIIRPSVMQISRDYVGLIRHFQSWTTFVTAPYIHTYSIKIQATDDEGRSRIFGPIIPGLKPYDNHIRTGLFFINTATRGFNEYFKRYAQRLCNAITESEGESFKPVTITLLEDYTHLRPLHKIRASGIIADPKTDQYGPFPCEYEVK